MPCDFLSTSAILLVKYVVDERVLTEHGVQGMPIYRTGVQVRLSSEPVVVTGEWATGDHISLDWTMARGFFILFLIFAPENDSHATG